MSGKNYFEAKNKAAKVFYILSIICFGTNTLTSGIEVYCHKCGLSKTGMLENGFEGLFLKAVNYINKIKWCMLTNLFTSCIIVPKMGTVYQGLAFLPTSSFQHLPY